MAGIGMCPTAPSRASVADLLRAEAWRPGGRPGGASQGQSPGADTSPSVAQRRPLIEVSPIRQCNDLIDCPVGLWQVAAPLRRLLPATLGYGHGLLPSGRPTSGSGTCSVTPMPSRTSSRSSVRTGQDQWQNRFPESRRANFDGSPPACLLPITKALQLRAALGPRCVSPDTRTTAVGFHERNHVRVPRRPRSALPPCSWPLRSASPNFRGRSIRTRSAPIQRRPAPSPGYRRWSLYQYRHVLFSGEPAPLRCSPSGQASQQVEASPPSGRGWRPGTPTPGACPG